MSDKSKEQKDAEILEIKIEIVKIFESAKKLGIWIDIPRQGHIILNPIDFNYYHR